MSTYVHGLRLGDLVAAAFDEAAYYSNDPVEVSHLAARTVMDLLHRARSSLLRRIAGELAAWENEGGRVSAGAVTRGTVDR